MPRTIGRPPSTNLPKKERDERRHAKAGGGVATALAGTQTFSAQRVPVAAGGGPGGGGGGRAGPARRPAPSVWHCILWEVCRHAERDALYLLWISYLQLLLLFSNRGKVTTLNRLTLHLPCARRQYFA